MKFCTIGNQHSPSWCSLCNVLPQLFKQQTSSFDAYHRIIISIPLAFSEQAAYRAQLCPDHLSMCRHAQPAATYKARSSGVFPFRAHRSAAATRLLLLPTGGAPMIRYPGFKERVLDSPPCFRRSGGGTSLTFSSLRVEWQISGAPSQRQLKVRVLKLGSFVSCQAWAWGNLQVLISQQEQSL